MNSIPLFKRLSTWANIISIIAASVMASPASLNVPEWLSPWVWPICSVLVAVCQVIKQNPNSKEWF